MKGGRQRIEFEGVSAQIRPETVSLAAADIAFDPHLVRSGDWLPSQGYRLALEEDSEPPAS